MYPSVAATHVFRLTRTRVIDGATASRHEREAPLEILKNRYAKGEISKAEFDRIKIDRQFPVKIRIKY
jgi:uncharacterized membrane protein